MDEGFSAAVIKVFVELYKRGLLYRDKRLVNWDPRFQTAISDLEVETREVAGQILAPAISARRRIGRDPGRDDAARDDARRHGGRGASRRRALCGAGRQDAQASDHRPPDPDRRRRACRSGAWLGRGQDHAGPRLQRFEVGKRAGLQARRHAQHARCHGAGRPDRRRADPRRSCSASTASRRASGSSSCSKPKARWRRSRTASSPRPYGDRSGVVIEPWLTDQWYVDVAPLAEPAMRRRARARSRSFPRPGRRPGSTGWRISSPGASRASSGGATASRPGSTRTGNVFVAETEEEAQAAGRRRRGAAPGRGRARHLVLLRPVAVRDAGLARADRRPQAPLPQRRAHLRLRHPVLLGRADGDAGHGVHGRGAVEDALPPRPGPRRARAEDVQVEGQYGRSARPDRQIWRRRAALHPGGDGKPGPRHQAR